MAINIDGPVGLRMRTQKVKKFAHDQEKVIGLLAKIPEKQGGKKESWATKPLAGPDGNCPKFVADAIWDFQVFWKARGVFRNIDSVVDPGMNTLRQLNKLAEGGAIEPPTPPTPVDPKTFPVDIVVRFTGGPTGTRRDEARERDFRRIFNTPAYLRTHQPIEAICFTGFREQEQFVSRAVADVVRRRGEMGRGATIVIGSSAGGVAALKTAVELTARNVRLSYVGINDAAFLTSNKSNEVATKPAFAINLAAVTGGRRIDADVRENFFQTLGHEWQADPKSPTGFFPHAEFHGPLARFVNISLHNKPRVLAVKAAFGAASNPFPLPVAGRDRFAALVHREAGAEAENLIRPRITGLIHP